MSRCRAWGHDSTNLWDVMAQGLGVSQGRAWGHRGTGLGSFMAQGLGTLRCRVLRRHKTEPGDIPAQGLSMSRHRSWRHHDEGLGDIVAQGLGPTMAQDLGTSRHRSWGRHGTVLPLRCGGSPLSACPRCPVTWPSPAHTAEPQTPARASKGGPELLPGAAPCSREAAVPCPALAGN